ncbi:MAG: phage tail protein [Mesorhizobium sp.]
MVKTPRTRHSKTQRAPVTIELGSDDVKRVDEPITDAPTEPEVTEPIESIEVPAQPDAELLKVEGEPVEEAKPGVVEEPAPKSDYSFGRAEPEPRPASSRPVPAKQGSMSNIAAGLIGAVLALGGFYGLQAAGVVGSPGGAAFAPSLEPVESQISALKSELDSLKAAPVADSGLASALDQLKSDVAGLQSAVQSGGAGDGAAVAALDERIKKLETAPAVAQDVESKIAEVESKVTSAVDAVANSDARIGTLEQSLSALTGKVEQQASQPKVALAIAAAALKSAVDRGGPFAAEAETFAAIAPNAPELAALRQYADQGVATEADLVASFPQAADAMIAASEPENPNAGVWQRLMDSAQSVVKVRPVGSVEGDQPGARVARMEVALKAGDLQKALAEYDGLPEAAKQAGASLADRIKGRIEVTKLVDQLVASAMKSA